MSHFEQEKRIIYYIFTQEQASKRFFTHTAGWYTEAFREKKPKFRMK